MIHVYLFIGENRNSDVFIQATLTHTPQQGVHTHIYTDTLTHVPVSLGSQSQVHMLIYVCVLVYVKHFMPSYASYLGSYIMCICRFVYVEALLPCYTS